MGSEEEEEVARDVSEFPIAADVAEHEFSRFARAWDIDTDVDTMNEEESDSYRGIKRSLLLSIRRGRLTVSDDGEQVALALRPGSFSSLQSVEFRVPTGSAMHGWDRFKDRQSIAKLNSFLGEMTGLPPATFVAMDGRDVKICQSVATLFLGS